MEGIGNEDDVVATETLEGMHDPAGIVPFYDVDDGMGWEGGTDELVSPPPSNSDCGWPESGTAASDTPPPSSRRFGLAGALLRGEDTFLQYPQAAKLSLPLPCLPTTAEESRDPDDLQRFFTGRRTLEGFKLTRKRALSFEP
jgi:hypothetical protein